MTGVNEARTLNKIRRRLETDGQLKRVMPIVADDYGISPETSRAILEMAPKEFWVRLLCSPEFQQNIAKAGVTVLRTSALPI